MSPSPMAMATMQSTALAACSNLAAQAFSAYRSNTPFTLSFPDLFRFTILNVLVCPPNFLWQIWLERTFPAYIDVKPSRFVEMEKGEGVLSPTVRKPKFHWFNTVKKWVLDCFTLGAIANTLAFLVVMGALKGKPVVVIVEAIKKDTLPIMIAGWKIWPVASFVSFTFVPCERRIVFLSFVGFLWGIYMSMVASRQ